MSNKVLPQPQHHDAGSRGAPARGTQRAAPAPAADAQLPGHQVAPDLLLGLLRRGEGLNPSSEALGSSSFVATMRADGMGYEIAPGPRGREGTEDLTYSVLPSARLLSKVADERGLRHLIVNCGGTWQS